MRCFRQKTSSCRRLTTYQRLVRMINKSIWKRFRNVITDYVHNSNVPGYKYLTRKNTLERCFWYVVHVCILASTFQLITYTWNEFMVHPIITTVESFTYPVNNIPIPGISICDNNKVSKMRAEIYAAKLANKSGMRKDDILTEIVGLGKLYDLNGQTDSELSVEFQNFLDTYDSGSQGHCNVHNTLKRLTTPCYKILSDCFLYDIKRDCEDLFVTELTMEGHCCMFNYISQSSIIVSRILRGNGNKSIVAGNVRIHGGLTFKLLFNISDYMFTTLPTLGAQILISLPKDFPDKGSGDLSEVLVAPGEEVFIKIFSTTTFSTPELKKYPTEQRNCIFQSEMNTIFGSYSSSDCVLDCKIKSIQAMCKCVPFNYIKAFKGLDYNQCTLADLACLRTHSRKWLTMDPSGYTGTSLDAEKQNSLPCSHCLPACSGTVYKVQSQTGLIFQNGKAVEDYSVVHISFASPFGTENKQDVVFYWYEIIGLFGGLLSFMMGVTFISIVEILYFFSSIFCKRN